MLYTHIQLQPLLATELGFILRTGSLVYHFASECWSLGTMQCIRLGISLVYNLHASSWSSLGYNGL
jgi:hypothetical protein